MNILFNIKKENSVFCLFICRYYHRICPSSFLCVTNVFFSTFLCVSFVFLCLRHIAFEKLNYHILFFICLLPFVYFIFIHHTNIFVGGMRVSCCLFWTLILYVLTVLSLSTSVCLFDFLFLRVPFFFQDKTERRK